MRAAALALATLLVAPSAAGATCFPVERLEFKHTDQSEPTVLGRDFADHVARELRAAGIVLESHDWMIARRAIKPSGSWVIATVRDGCVARRGARVTARTWRRIVVRWQVMNP